jgi:chromate transporter
VIDEYTPGAQLPPHARTSAARLRELATLFLKLGTIGFGGPAAHIALMEAEVVRERQWLTREQFLDLLGAANLIPGPTSTEMAINVGYARAGWAGLCVAGVSFILPAALITGAFAWAYVRFGAMTQAVSVLAGVKAAVIAIIALAIGRLGKTAVKSLGLGVLCCIAVAAFFLGVNPIVILFGGGVVGMLALRVGNFRSAGTLLFSLFLSRPRFSLIMERKMWASWMLPTAAVAVTSAAGAVSVRPSVYQIGLYFLKLGAVLYGGGYVLLAFLEQGLVQQHAWLTHQQLLDSVAIGQFTPGPVFSTATFIGYILGGAPGAAVATVAIFLPSFLYVALLAQVLFRLRQSAWMAAFLDSVNVCAVGLMGGVTFRLAGDALRGWPSWLISAVSLVLLLRWKTNPAWIVLGGGIAGLAFAAFH